jgi:hypothetical protein
VTLAEDVVQEPNSPEADLPLVPAAEQQRQFAGGSAAVPSLSGVRIDTLFEQQVDGIPNARPSFVEPSRSPIERSTNGQTGSHFNCGRSACGAGRWLALRSNPAVR